MSGADACSATRSGAALPHDSIGTSINLKPESKRFNSQSRQDPIQSNSLRLTWALEGVRLSPFIRLWYSIADVTANPTASCVEAVCRPCMQPEMTEFRWLIMSRRPARDFSPLRSIFLKHSSKNTSNTYSIAPDERCGSCST
uniref:Uncharacterized protein n=1 Tax=Anopheles farauti TaxID=69004 RepID=A0A182Q1B3_9DIPT